MADRIEATGFSDNLKIGEFPRYSRPRGGAGNRKNARRREEAEETEPRHGFIHDALEIKLLILFVLRRLPAEIDGELLGDLVLIDGGFDYFEYKECLADLVTTAQVEAAEDGYRVTAKGSRNCEALENTLPYSVRAKAERAMAPVIAEMRRREMILANHEVGKKGVTVYLAVSDGIGNIFDLKMLVADEEQARRIEKNFKKRAERFYQEFLDALST